MLMKLLASHEVEDLELPPLDISDTSTSAVEVSARGDVSSSDEEGGCNYSYRPRRKVTYCADDNADTEQSKAFDSGRRRGGQHLHRVEAADRAIDLSTRSDGRGFSRRNSRSLSPPTKAAKARRSRSSIARFSYSTRRSSLGGTTVYRTAYMASLDAYLNTTSGLRLQPDGKCIFTFEKRRVVLRCAAPEDGGDGDYTLCMRMGQMKELQVKFRSKNLLKWITSWNDELKLRCLRRQRRRAQDDNQEIPSSGLLQIDSNKPGDANVAFIYYGHVDDIKNAVHFQTTLDDFVDDALYLYDRIINDRQRDIGVKNCNSDRHHQYMTRSLPSFHTEKNHERSKLLMNNYPSRRQSTSPCKPVVVDESTFPSFNANNIDVSATNENNDKETNSKSILSRMISSLRSKSGDISFSPHISLGNQEQDCYVVDRQAIEEGTVKPTIILSRVGAPGGAEVSEKTEDASEIQERQLHIRRLDEYRCRRDSSRPGRGGGQRIDAATGTRCDRPRQRRSTTFDSDVDDRDYSCHETSRRADDSDSRRQSTKQVTSTRPHRKTTVFIADDFSDRRQSVDYRRRV